MSQSKPAAPAAQRILLATDFSSCSEAAAEVAAHLARTSGATLHVLHVAGPGDSSLSRELGRLTERLGDLPRRTLAVEVGRPADEIVRYAGEHAIDLIVVGTHGRTGLTHLVRGSVAEDVVRRAACNVLTVKPSARTQAAETPEQPAGPPTCLLCAGPGGPVCDNCAAMVTTDARVHKLREARVHV